MSTFSGALMLLIRATCAVMVFAACTAPNPPPPFPPSPPAPGAAPAPTTARNASAPPPLAVASAPEPTRYTLGPELTFEQSRARPRVTPFRKNVVMPRVWRRAGATLLSDALYGSPSTLITPKGRRSIGYQTAQAWISPDGALLALQDDDAGLVFLSAASGAKLAAFPRHACAARWTSGQTLVALTREELAMATTIQLQRWDRETAALTAIGEEHAAYACELSVDAKTALLWAPGRKVMALDLTSDRKRSLWDPPPDEGAQVVLSPRADRACAVPSLLSPGPLECVTVDGHRERLLDHFGGQLTLDASGKRAVAYAITRGERTRCWLVDFDEKTVRPFARPGASSGALSEGGALYAETTDKDHMRVLDFDAGVVYETLAKLSGVDAIVGDSLSLLGTSDVPGDTMMVDAHLVVVPPSGPSGQ